MTRHWRGLSDNVNEFLVGRLIQNLKSVATGLDLASALYLPLAWRLVAPYRGWRGWYVIEIIFDFETPRAVVPYRPPGTVRNAPLNQVGLHRHTSFGGRGCNVRATASLAG